MGETNGPNRVGDGALDVAVRRASFALALAGLVALFWILGGIFPLAESIGCLTEGRVS
jgi:hypothetical protein